MQAGPPQSPPHASLPRAPLPMHMQQGLQPGARPPQPGQSPQLMGPGPVPGVPSASPGAHQPRLQVQMPRSTVVQHAAPMQLQVGLPYLPYCLHCVSPQSKKSLVTSLITSSKPALVIDKLSQCIRHIRCGRSHLMHLMADTDSALKVILLAACAADAGTGAAGAQARADTGQHAHGAQR